MKKITKLEKIKKVRVLKVYHLHMDYSHKHVPCIRLSGKWVEEAGYKIGNRILVAADKESIIIKNCNQIKL